jgi:hypothetical protein
MNKVILICLLVIVGLAFNTSNAAVTVTLKQEQYVFTHEPRLDEVLAPISDDKTLYWSAAALYKVDDSHLEKLRQILLNNLLTLANRYQIEEPEITQSLKQLQSTIARWHLARRLPVKIDYDLARIVAAANPRLPQGKYILNLGPRINTVQIFGAVHKQDVVPHLNHADASEYFTHKNLSILADKDYVMLIQADGRQIKVPVAYWNKAHQEVMPGSQLFVPFKQSLFHPEFASINQQIMMLALNRVRS